MRTIPAARARLSSVARTTAGSALARSALPYICLLAALLGSVSPVDATRLRPLNLEELTHKAARIVSGRTVAVEPTVDPVLNVPVTVVTIDVERSLKGDTAGTLTFKMLGGQGLGVRRGGPAGLPGFEAGQEVILFLYGESRAGLTSPVGFGQGKFVKVRDKQGRALARNGNANRTLFRGLTADASARLGGARDALAHRPGLPPDALLDMVERLLRAGNARPVGRRP